MHPMFAELFMQPDEEPESDERRLLRRTRRLRTLSATRGLSAASRNASAARSTA
jgi:hypothetical protein